MTISQPEGYSMFCANTKPDFEKMWRETQRNFDAMEARAIRLEKALIESRDILCALNTTDRVTKLAHMAPAILPDAIKHGYEALQEPAQ